MLRLNHRPLHARLIAVAALVSLWPSSANARSLTLLGVSGEPIPVARFLARDAESAFTYESLSLLELSLHAKGKVHWTPIVDENQALRHQRAGVSDLHRIILERKTSEVRDNSELLGFKKAQEVACYSMRVEAKKPPVHLDLHGNGHGYAWTCVLASEDTPAARLLLEVKRKATAIHFAPDNQRPVIRVAQIPHMQVEIPHRGVRALPVITLTKAYRVPHSDQKRFIYLFIFKRSLPLIAKLAPQEILVFLHPDALQRPDGGLITHANILSQAWALR